MVDRSIALGSTSGGGQSTTATSSALIFLNGVDGSITTRPTISTGVGLNIGANSVSTGDVARIYSGSTTLSSGQLLDLDWSPGTWATASGNLVNINIGEYGDTTGNLFNISDNLSSLFSVSTQAVTSALPVAFNAAGDVSIAYDINFTNPTASYIKSGASLYLAAGKVFNSDNLTLSTYNKGNVIVDSEAFVTNYAATISGQLVLGTTTPTHQPANFGKLYLEDSSTSTASAFFYNSGANTATIMALKTGDTTATGIHFIDLLDGSGKSIGTAKATSDTVATWQSGGIDLAEFFSVDPPYAGTNNSLIQRNFPPGTLICHGASGVKPCDPNESSSIIGAVSTAPAFLGGQEGPDKIMVALVGQVPVRVSSDSASISKGDFITTGSIAGQAIKATTPTTVLGTALEDWSPGGEKSMIKVLINVTWQDPNGDLVKNLLSLLEKGIFEAKNIISEQATFLSAEIGELTSNNIQLTTALISPLVEATQLKTDLISPLSDSNIVIQLGKSDNTENPDNFGQLLVKNQEDQTVASIDSSGNATFSGTLEAESANFNNLTIQQFNNEGDATISGTLYADDIITKNGSFGDLLKNSSPSSITNIYNITQVVSPTTSPSPTPDSSPTPILSPSATIEQLNYETTSSPSSNLASRINDFLSSSPPPIDVNEEIPFSQDSQIPTMTTYIPSRLDKLYVNDELNVLGDTSLGNTTISGTFMVDGGLILESNKISTSTDTLYISSLDTINFFGGKIVMNKDGNLTIDGTLIARGGVETTEIKPPPGQDLSINLATNQNSSPSRFGQLLIKGEKGVVTSIDSSGNITTQGDILGKSAHFTDQVKVGSLSLPGDFSGTNSANIKYIGSPSKNGQTVPSLSTISTSGLSILPQGYKELIMYNPYITENSLIYLTPLTSTGNQSLYVSEKVAGSFFKVALDGSLNYDLKFNWWILEGRSSL